MNAPRDRKRPLDAAVNPNSETASQRGPAPGDQDRRGRIAVAAYYNAERRGFREGGEHDDWLQAEKQIDRLDESGARLPRQDDLGHPDHRVPREPRAAGHPHDAAPGKAGKKRKAKSR